ncbi:hypothetical protein AKJ56_01195 [candidate division MSBL1 archaeon SCGC-AAA382N08]|uniref:Uncharacterized protein n=1 Tax=candidate division MSBL1 archaeon SCGC-AAA382N08 TaxID=1698285 RepID=A0A133VPV2_9EURY|nr:hypothetical protein AKJ56_01195 [candidate division MSBL1 archaeon SCGC-AAA382N08]
MAIRRILHPNHVWKIRVHPEEDKSHKVLCRVKNNGLCVFEAEEKLKFGILSAAYRYIRDVYHHHIHHSEDQPLQLVEAEKEEEAIEKIIDQYRRKIIYYNRHAHSFLKENEYSYAFEEIISPGIGEMNYAKNFATLFQKGDKKNNLIQTFNNSVNSLRALRDKAKINLEKSSDFWSHFLTLFVIFFGSLGSVAIFGREPIFSLSFSLIVTFLVIVSLYIWVYKD